MVNRRRITDLPPEIRRQIFSDYFKVSGGYVYDGMSDKLRNADETPIDLSLAYTCRLIAQDCRNLPLAVNTIHFHTLYREDWRSLAGCFNLAATYYNLLQQDLVLHLAHLITPDMHTQLEREFPTFKSKLKAEREFHFKVWRTGEDTSSANTVAGNPLDPARPTICEWIQDFFKFQVLDLIKYGPYSYTGYGRVHVEIGDTPRYSHDDLDQCDHAYKRWDSGSGEIHRCLAQCLRLIANESPEEFSSRIYAYLPHWTGKYPAENFFDLRFEYWAIPERHQVSNAMELLGIPVLVWKFPDMWRYDGDFFNKLPQSFPPKPFSDELENPTFDFKMRVREKIRFSAAAAAIRFLGLLPKTQRTGIRTIIIHEDYPSVNRSPLYGNGLIPFLKENTLLRIDRRVNIANTVLTICSGPEDMADTVARNSDRSFFTNELDISEISNLLLEALAVANADIPAGSFTLLLESGPESHLCTEAFQQLIHGQMAMNMALGECADMGLLRSLTSRQMTLLKHEFGFEDEFTDAIAQLVNQTSNVLRGDFNPGLPQDHQSIVDAVGKAADVWEYLEDFIYKYFETPDHLETRERYAQMFEFQTQDEYRRSLA